MSNPIAIFFEALSRSGYTTEALATALEVNSRNINEWIERKKIPPRHYKELFEIASQHNVPIDVDMFAGPFRARKKLKAN